MKWDIKKEFKTANSKFKIVELIDILLENRGIKTKKERDEFLNANLESITPKAVGFDPKQLKKAIHRIKKAIEKKEQIVVFGDYDVDGITASAILWETLNDLGGNVLPYIPNRMTEGYGLSIDGIKNLELKIKNPKLIITVDNGIVADKAVDFANSKGMDVIITDHHVPQGEKNLKYPDAYAIVHTTKLCGAGVAWLLAQQILNVTLNTRKEMILNSPKGASQVQNDINSDSHLELAALGTVADLVPLTGANRIIVREGLKNLRSTKRIGLLALFKEAGVDTTFLGVYEIGHIIAPRLNASGRMSSAMDSLRLLCTKNKNRAEELANLLGTINKERQDVMRSSSENASTNVKSQISKLKAEKRKKIIIVADESYQQGIIGLVAGRLVEEYYLPSIVISKGEKHSKASVRSISGVNIIAFLRQASDLLVDVGGHPMAAGFTVETEKIDELVERLEKMAEEIIGEDLLVRSLRVDCELGLKNIDSTLYRSLEQLEPFGMGNPEPTFASRNVIANDIKTIGKLKNHLKLRVKGEGGREKYFDAIGFGMGYMNKEIKEGSRVDIVFAINENIWNGNKSLQLKVKDLKIN